MKAIYRIIDGVGGTADTLTYEEAVIEAGEETEDRAVILAITLTRGWVDIPVAFAMHGTVYPVALMECPYCQGTKLIVTDWDEYAYENIQEDCPDCNGTGMISGSELRGKMEAQP